jgi:hypothetical protein
MTAKNAMRGSMIAAMAAGMFLSALPATSSAGDAAKVHCQGVNSCKGQGACNSASNSCAGKNSCKGKGWIELSAKDCKAKRGTVAAPIPMK